MNYFVIQVLTKSEEKFIRLANRMVRRAEQLEWDRTAGVQDALGALPLDGGFSSRQQVADSSDHERSGAFIELPSGFSPTAPAGRLVWPRRRLTIRRKGIQQSSLAPIFPGYVFYEAEEVRPEIYWILKRMSGFVRFLKNEDRLERLSGADRELLLHFLSYGEVVDRSLVYFDENNRIRVKSGPMKGLEGQVVKVDKRKRRAKIRLSMYSDHFLVDFGFELLESAEGHERQAE